MKKLFILLFIIFGTLIRVYADNNELWLDLGGEKEQLPTEQKVKPEKLDIKSESSTNINPQNIHGYINRDLYTKQNVTYKKEKKYKNMTYGAQYDTTLNPENASQTSTLYSKYNVTKKMSVGTSYKSDSSKGFQNQDKGTISVAPEYKFNNRYSLKNEYSRDIGNNKNKAELKLKVNPFKDDNMDFSVGAGQVQNNNSGATSSQINFGTNIRF